MVGGEGRGVVSVSVGERLIGEVDRGGGRGETEGEKVV